VKDAPHMMQYKIISL